MNNVADTTEEFIDRICRKLIKKFNFYKLNTTFGLDTDSLFNDCKSAAWIASGKFNPEKYPNTKLTTYLYTVVKHHLIAVWKKEQQKNKERLYGDVSEIDDENLCYVENNNSENEFVKFCLNKIPNPHREILKNKFYEEKTLKEISDIYNISIESARQKLNKAIKIFKNVYGVYSK